MHLQEFFWDYFYKYVAHILSRVIGIEKGSKFFVDQSIAKIVKNKNVISW